MQHGGRSPQPIVVQWRKSALTWKGSLLQDIWLTNDVEHLNLTEFLPASLLPAPTPACNHSLHRAFCPGPLLQSRSSPFTSDGRNTAGPLPVKVTATKRALSWSLCHATFPLGCFHHLVLWMLGELPGFQSFHLVPHRLSHLPAHCWLSRSENCGLTGIWVTGWQLGI